MGIGRRYGNALKGGLQVDSFRLFRRVIQAAFGPLCKRPAYSARGRAIACYSDRGIVDAIPRISNDACLGPSICSGGRSSMQPSPNISRNAGVVPY